ncbi:MAG: hypothetical protein J2P34_11465, partial [Actinobacteria bacterium]|nr:hypothetical protein [Actinomycetota bacterium]
MAATAGAPAAKERPHGWIIFGIWLPLSIIAVLLIWFVWRPHMPPGDMTLEAEGQQFDITILAAIGAPVLLFVWIYAAYALITWRQRPGDDTDGPAIYGTTRIQATWITVTAAIVLFLFGFGTYELIVPAGAGGGEGPAPIWNPPGVTTAAATQVHPAPWSPGGKTPLVVQAIGQQWQWTYRYPQFGGMETTALVLPDNTQVVLHTTSLDV